MLCNWQHGSAPEALSMRAKALYVIISKLNASCKETPDGKLFPPLEKRIIPKAAKSPKV